jgi:uncharacterized protein
MFNREIPHSVSEHIVRIMVFGSYARDEALPDSDLDIAVLVKHKSTELIGALDDSAYRVMWKYDFDPVISLKIFEEREFLDAADKGFSFYRNVLRKKEPL